MKAALRIAVYYALLSGLYIVLSDTLVDLISQRNPDVARGWQNLKGISFVLGSAVIIFMLILHYLRGRQAAEDAREEAVKSFEQLFRRNPLPILVYDTASLAILAVNEAAVEEYGHTEADFLQLTLPDLHPAEDVEKLMAHLARVRPYSYTGHWRHLRKDGSPAEVEIVSHPMTFGGKSARLAVATNIGIRKITEKALADAFLARLDAEEAKTRFLGAISHEMRTPLNAIVGFLDLMPRERDESLRAEYVSIAQKGADELLAMIEKLMLAASLTGADGVSREMREVEMGPFLERVRSAYLRSASRKRIKLDLNIDGAVPAVAVMDAARVEATLEILVGNAVKFSDHGTIVLAARFDREKGRLALEVIDEGIGIPKNLQPRVFESFFQVDQGETRKYGGVGMGLFVARQLSDLIGAELLVESTGNAGSTFRVTLRGELDEQGRFVSSGAGREARNVAENVSFPSRRT